MFSFAWDVRDKEHGGQRWYHNYSHEDIRPEDRLHWRQPLHNWNCMCADCHSDGLIRNYDVEKIAHRKGEERNNAFMENCFSCYSLLSPVTPTYNKN